MVRNPFFSLKIARLKATVHRVVHSSGSPDPADFAMTRQPIHWRVLELPTIIRATIGISRPSQRDMPIDEKPGRSNIRQNLPAVAYQTKPLVFYIDRCVTPWTVALRRPIFKEHI
jgi:hypothetical protein